jgi:hypothetical protein
MSARIYLHPCVTLEDVHRMYRLHGLVAVTKPIAASKAHRQRVELVPLTPPPWHALQVTR